MSKSVLKIMKFAVRFRIITAVIAWLQARKNYYDTFTRDGKVIVSNNKPHRMQYVGALAYHLLNVPLCVESFPWQPLLQMHRAFRAVGPIEPRYRHRYLWADGSVSRVELVNFLRRKVVEVPCWRDYTNRCLMNRKRHGQKFHISDFRESNANLPNRETVFLS